MWRPWVQAGLGTRRCYFNNTLGLENHVHDNDEVLRV